MSRLFGERLHVVNVGLSSFAEYREHLAESDRETESFINSISTNHTKFFREAHHFDHFRTHVALPFVQAAHRATDRRLRIWSAGCSTGEEPYTIAVVLKREMRNIDRHDVRILATDIDTDVLGKAARGEYSLSAIDDIPKTYRDFFQPADDEGANVVMDDDLRSLIAFRRLNLMDPWPFHGLFDAIFCRNVMIYFDAETRRQLVHKLYDFTAPGGYLFLGHSETIDREAGGYVYVRPAVYRKLP